MLPLLFCFVVVVVAVVAGFIHFTRRGKIKGLPEPPGNFIVGHVLQVGMGSNFCKTFLKWKSDLGPVFQLRFFSIWVVVFNDRKSMAKVCAMRQASGRARTGSFLLASDIIGEGVGFGEGARWLEQRQLLVRSLKIYGIGHPETEKRLQDEIAITLGKWGKLEGAAFELHGCNTDFVFNALWSVIASKRMEHAAISRLSHHQNAITKMDTIGHKFASLTINFVGKFTNAVEEKRQGYEALAQVARESVIEHQKDRRPSEPRDVIDEILDKMDATDDVNSAFHKTNIKTGFALGDVIAATIDTVSRTLEWLMFHLAQNPGAASKLHDEIDRVLGNDLEPWPSLADRDNMPYAQACILEALRIGSVVAFGIPHRALEDFEFNGAHIPKGTILIMNLYGVHHDPEVWDHPDKFQPERFLTQKGDSIDPCIKNKIVPFGIGRRICPGYSLAMHAMFLFLVNAYRKFKFQLVSYNGTCEGRFGVTHYPPKGILLRAVSRQER